MNYTEQLAKKITQYNGQNEEQVAFDPATALVIAKLVISIISALKDCKKSPEEATVTISSPSYKDYRRTKALVRRQLGWFKYWRHGQFYVDKLMNYKPNVSLNDVQQCYKEVK